MLFIKTSRDALLAPLQTVAGIVEKRHTLPILSNVLLEHKGDVLTFLATDIEMQITTSCSSTFGEMDGAITASARKLQEILRSLPDSAEVSLLLENRRLQVRAGRSRFNLQTLPPEDFPCMAAASAEKNTLMLSQRDLRRLFAQTQYSMASQDVRYYLNGLLLILDAGELRAVATDGHRLAYASMSLSRPPESSSGEVLDHQELILPRKTVIELSRLLGDNDEEVCVEMLANQIRFQFGQTTLISKLIDGRFPDYQRVIPTTLSNVVSLNRSILLQSLIRAAILTNEKFRGVRLVLSNGVLQVIAANAEQEEAQDEIEVDYHGEPIDVGFNVAYLLDVLNNTDCENIE